MSDREPQDWKERALTAETDAASWKADAAEQFLARQKAEGETLRLREGLEDIATEEFTGSPGMSIYAAAANELGRVKRLARSLLSSPLVVGK